MGPFYRALNPHQLPNQLEPFDLEVDGGNVFFDRQEFARKNAVYFLIEGEQAFLVRNCREAGMPSPVGNRHLRNEQACRQR